MLPALLVFLCCARGAGQVVLPVTNETLANPFPIYLSHVQVLWDETNNMEAAEVARQNFYPFSAYFNKIPDHLPITKRLWLKLELQSQYANDTTIVFYSGFQNYVHAWYADSGRITPVASCGNMIPAWQLSIKQFRQALYLPLQAGKINRFYISVYNRTNYHTDPLKPYLMSQDSLNEIQLKSLRESRSSDFIFFAGLGMFLIMIIYLLIKWAYLKDTAYFYYALSLFGGAVFYLSSFLETGNNMLAFGQNPELVYMTSDAFALAGVFGYWEFVRKFLYVDKEKPSLGKYMRTVAYIILGFMVLTQVLVFINGNIWQYIQRNTIAGFVFLVLGLYVFIGIRRLNQPLRRVVYGGIIVTIIFYFAASFYEVLRGTRYEVLPELGGGAPILMLGTMFQMLFSVIGLAYRNKLESVEAADIKIQKSEAEMKALRAQMNPHFIFNCMHTIDAYIFKEQPDKASAFLNKFSKLVRQTLENSEKPLIPLAKEIESLMIYTALEQERYDGSFETTYNIDERTRDYKVPPLLLQPFAENAILHGLRHLKKGGGRLTIETKDMGSVLNIYITDNGIGREAAMEMNKIRNAAHTSMAVDLTRQRLRFTHHDKMVEGTVQVNDLPGAGGTQVIISLPKIEK